MEIDQVSPGSIVVGKDGSPCSDGALDWAVDQAVLEARPITVVHGAAPMNAPSVGLYPSGSFGAAHLVDEARDWAETVLDAAAARARDRQPGVEVQQVVSVADPRTVLFELGERAEMIVLGSRGRGPVASLLLGSVSVSIARQASCPVVVWRTGDQSPPRQRILLGIDGTEHSLSAIEFAYRMASLRGSALTVLYCTSIPAPVTPVQEDGPWPDLSAERALVSESLAGMANTYPEVSIAVEMVDGFADDRLIAASGEHDLVVVGHQRIGHLKGLIHDSVSTAVLEHATGIVAVVPARPFVY